MRRNELKSRLYPLKVVGNPCFVYSFEVGVWRVQAVWLNKRGLNRKVFLIYLEDYSMNDIDYECSIVDEFDG